MGICHQSIIQLAISWGQFHILLPHTVQNFPFLQKTFTQSDCSWDLLPNNFRESRKLFYRERQKKSLKISNFPKFCFKKAREAKKWSKELENLNLISSKLFFLSHQEQSVSRWEKDCAFMHKRWENFYFSFHSAFPVLPSPANMAH